MPHFPRFLKRSINRQKKSQKNSKAASISYVENTILRPQINEEIKNESFSQNYNNLVKSSGN